MADKIDTTEKIIIDREYYYDLIRRAEASDEEIVRKSKERSMKMGVANITVEIKVDNRTAPPWRLMGRYNSRFHIYPFMCEQNPWRNSEGKFYISERMRRAFEERLKIAVRNLAEPIAAGCNEKSYKDLLIMTCTAVAGWFLFILSLIIF